jgi:uncharacterized protein (TIGR03382 family)
VGCSCQTPAGISAEWLLAGLAVLLLRRRSTALRG